MKNTLILSLLLIVVIPVFAARKALVIGNAEYEQGVLRNPVNDSADMAEVLSELGFLVSSHQNLNRAGFYKAVGDFVSAISPSDEVVFYYSGHAVQIEGTNYLIPVNEFIDSETRCAFLSYSGTMLLEELKRAAISVIILDACRDNPFSFSRSLSKGLAPMRAGGGTQLVVFATEDGKTAEDGSGRNSPFTESLLANIRTPDKKITDLIQIVSNDVAIKTHERQIPISTGILRHDFFFTKAGTAPVVTLSVSDITPVKPTTAIEIVKPAAVTEFGTIKIVSKFGGDLYLDGEFNQSLFSGASATWNDIKTGVHTVELKSLRENHTRKVNVIKNQTSLIDFDAPDTFVEELSDTPKDSKSQAQKSAQKDIQPSRPPLPPIKNLLSGGSGNMEILSPVAGDIYLGGRMIGNVEANKTKKFNKLDAGDFTMELLSPFSCYRQEVRLSDKGVTKVNISLSDITPFLRELIYMPGGEYMRGSQFVDRSDHERPRHEVLLPPFLMSYIEVTQELWETVMSENPSARTGKKLPVTNVSWYDAVEFCIALSKLDGLEPCYRIDKEFTDINNISDFDTMRYSVTCNWQANGYRLPTEAEWEYAAKCGDSSNSLKFSGSNLATEVAWHDMNSNRQVQEVATRAPNAWGFFDLSGNVFEWCWDYWGSYFKDKQIHPKGLLKGSYRVARGGSWQTDADLCSNTARGGFSPNTKSNEIGFRIVRSARAN